MKSLFFSLAIAAISSVAQAAPPAFTDYVLNLKKEALAQGISKVTVDSAFADVRFIEHAVKLDKNQPEFKLTLDTYLPKAVPEWKVKMARRQYQDNYSLLKRIGLEYGVEPQFIVALWGIETGFGKYTGNYSLISSLSTLAYDGRREAFFKKELFAALRIIDEGHATPQTLKGSWAGAMGQVQFMPSSFLNFAVDYDGDGRKDLWHTRADVFASAANYLQQHGWHHNGGWSSRVRVPSAFDESLIGVEVKKPVADWYRLGVRSLDGSALPSRAGEASVVMPDDKHGRAYLAYNNYMVLRSWNRSNYFVISVGYLADRIVGG